MLTLEDSKSLVQEENLKAKPKVSNEEEEEEDNDESCELITTNLVNQILMQ